MIMVLLIKPLVYICLNKMAVLSKNIATFSTWPEPFLSNKSSYYFLGVLCSHFLFCNYYTPPLHSGKTPFELLHHTVPDFSLLRIFCCLCYIHFPNSNKFQSCSRKCTFVGYPLGKHGWWVHDLNTNEFLVSQDIVFCENIFPHITLS